MAQNDGTVVIENARIIFRNFQGKESEFNREGDRNFGVILPEELAIPMEQDGWNVKRLKPNEEEKEAGIEFGPWWLQVKVGYRGGPPKIVTITSRGKTAITEDTVETLDWVEIATAGPPQKNEDPPEGSPLVDIIIRPYHYDVSGRKGISAYLKTMFLTINEDPLEQKYAQLDAQ